MNKTQLHQLLSLAAKQHGVIALYQALGLGVSHGQLEAAVKRGWLIPYRRGVFALRGGPDDDLRSLMAALLAAGSRAVVSHASAGVLHHFYGIAALMIELITPADARIRLAGVRTHRTNTLKRSDVKEVYGLRVTSPVRTIIDLAPRFKAGLLGEIIDEGSIAKLWTPEQIGARYAQLRNGQPTSALPELLEARLGEGNLASRLEQRVYRVLKPVVAPFEPHHTEVLDGVPIEMDMAWRDDKVDGEVDGLAVRTASRTKFARQVRRENILAKHGWRIVHFTYEMDDATIIAQVAPLLGRGPASF